MPWRHSTKNNLRSRNNDFLTLAQRIFCAHYNIIEHKNKTLSSQSIKNVVQNFVQTGLTIDKPRSSRPKNIERVKASVREQNGLTTRKRLAS